MKLRKLTGILLSVTMLFGGSTAVLADTEMEKPDTVEAGNTKEEDLGAENGEAADRETANTGEDSAGSTESSAGTIDGGKESPGSGAGPADDSTESTDSGVGITDSGMESTDNGAEISDGGTDSSVSDTESAESGTESADSSTESTESRKENTDKDKDGKDSRKNGTESKKEEEEKKEEETEKEKESSSESTASAAGRTYIPPSPATVTKSEFTLVGKVPVTVSTKEIHLNIREARNTDARIIAKLANGCTAFCLSDPSDEWAYIEAVAQDGVIVRGYCRTEYLVSARDGTAETPKKVIPRCGEDENAAFRDYLTTTQQSLVDKYKITTTVYGAAASGDAAAVIAYGEQFIGTPYAYASESLTEGTDCSGFTQGVFGAFGISLPRTAADQAECGTKVAVSDLVPGDLVFYRSDSSVMDDRAPNGVTHVMIYLGNSQVLHASSSAGQVTISDINLGSICWGVRILTGSSLPKASHGTGTLLSDVLATAEKARDGDDAAREDIIGMFGHDSGRGMENGLARRDEGGSVLEQCIRYARGRSGYPLGFVMGQEGVRWLQDLRYDRGSCQRSGFLQGLPASIHRGRNKCRYCT